MVEQNAYIRSLRSILKMILKDANERRKTMGYGKSSVFFNIPYMEAGDFLVESEEGKKANMIGNLLYVATFGATNAILTDASYELSQVVDNTCSLLIRSTNSVSILPSVYATFIAIINGYLSYKTGEIRIDNISQGSIWYVYACCNEEMLVDASRAAIISSTSRHNDINHILLATIDFTGSSPVLDFNTGKKFYANMSQHSISSTNPHGTSLTQAELNITSSLKIASKSIFPYTIIDVDLDGNNDVTVSSSDTGVIPEFVSIMGSNLVTAKISNSNVVFSSDSAVSIRAKIEGRLA